MPSHESPVETWSIFVLDEICAYVSGCTEIDSEIKDQVYAKFKQHKFSGLDLSLVRTARGKTSVDIYQQIQDVLRPHIDTMSWVDSWSDRITLSEILTEAILYHMDREENSNSSEASSSSESTSRPIHNLVLSPSKAKSMPFSRFVTIPSVETGTQMVYLMDGQFAYACTQRSKMKHGWKTSYRVDFQLFINIIGFRWQPEFRILSTADGMRKFSVL